MIKDITLGQYYNKDSVIHELDPRVKLVATFVFLISLFISTNIYAYILATIFLISEIINIPEPQQGSIAFQLSLSINDKLSVTT